MASSHEVTTWRIVKRKHAKMAFTGEGSRLFGGRWNSPGSALVYTAQSQSLAALEMVVHLDSFELLKAYVLFEVRIDASLITQIAPSTLPGNWREDQPPPALSEVGDRFIAEASSAVLRVPGVLVPGEDNFLINPQHEDFRKIRVGPPIPFRFDPRLIRLR